MTPIKSLGKIPLMAFLATALAISLIAFPSVQASPDSWAAKAPMPTARGGLGVAAVDGKICAIGGSTQNSVNGTILNTTEEYDPATNNWMQKAPMPTPRTDFAMAVYQNQIYCIGGISGQAANFLGPGMNIVVASLANEVYNPATDTWTAKAQMPYRVYGHITANVVDDKIVILDHAVTQPDLIYDPAANTWTVVATNSAAAATWNDTTMAAFKITVANYSSESNNFASAVVDDKIYMVPSGLRTLFIYDAANQNWILGTAYPSSFSVSAAVTINDDSTSQEQIYFLGPTATNAYNPTTDRWQTETPMPTNRTDFGIAVLNNQIYAIGGYMQGESNQTYLPATAASELYTPSINATPTPSSSPTPESQAMSASLSESASALDFGKRINFTVSVEGGNAPFTYAWYIDGKLVENSTSPYYATDSQAVGSHHIYVEVKDADNNTAKTLSPEFNVLPSLTYMPSSSVSPTQQPTLEPSQTLDRPQVGDFAPMIIPATMIFIAIIAVGLLVYFRRRG